MMYKIKYGTKYETIQLDDIALEEGITNFFDSIDFSKHAQNCLDAIKAEHKKCGSITINNSLYYPHLKEAQQRMVVRNKIEGYLNE